MEHQEAVDHTSRRRTCPPLFLLCHLHSKAKRSPQPPPTQLLLGRADSVRLQCSPCSSLSRASHRWRSSRQAACSQNLQTKNATQLDTPHEPPLSSAASPAPTTPHPPTTTHATPWIRVRPHFFCKKCARKKVRTVSTVLLSLPPGITSITGKVSFVAAQAFPVILFIGFV